MEENGTDERIEFDFQQGLEDSEEEFEAEIAEAAAHVYSCYTQSKFNRRTTESRWAKSWDNFRGHYSNREAYTGTERSDVFIKITKTKTLAAYGQIVDIVLSDNTLPIEICHTNDPINTETSVYVDLEETARKAQEGAKGEEKESPPITSALGVAGDGRDSKRGDNILDRIKNFLSTTVGDEAEIKVGDGNGKALEYNPAKEAAVLMTRKIKDQLQESNAAACLRKAMLEMALMGTGVVKGPFLSEKEYPNWDAEGNYTPTVVKVPKCEHVSCWDFFPDPDAKNIDEAEWAIQRHKLSKSQLQAFKREPHFRSEQINYAIERGAGYHEEYWENDLEEDNARRSDSNRYEVLEFWGYIDVEKVEDIDDFDIPDEFEEHSMIPVNIFVCNNQVIRMVANPFTPVRLPFKVAYFEEDPYNFFGVGVPENMEDSQTVMNGFARMAIDNAVLSGSIMLEVDEDNLVSGQDMSIYPGKVWRRQGGAPGQSVFGIQFPNVTPQNMQVFDKFRALADESTGIMSMSPQGIQGGVGRTSSGLSQMIGAASLPIKNVIKNIDENIIVPLGKDLFAFNMQFNFDPNLPTDLEVKSTGVASVITKDSRLQKLMQFMQTAGQSERFNEAYVLQEIARVLDLDPDKVLNSIEEAQLKMIMNAQASGMAAQAQGQAPQGAPGVPQPGLGPQGQQAPPGPAPGLQDEVGSGGGQPSIGTAPQPGTQQFSGPQ